MMGKHQPAQQTSIAGENRSGEPHFGALLMTEGGTQRSGPPPLFRGLTEGEKALVLESGKRTS